MNLFIRLGLGISPLMIGYLIIIFLMGQTQIKVHDEVQSIEIQMIPVIQSGQNAQNELTSSFQHVDDLFFIKSTSSANKAKKNLEASIQSLREIQKISASQKSAIQQIIDSIETTLLPLIEQYLKGINQKGSEDDFEQIQWQFYENYTSVETKLKSWTHQLKIRTKFQIQKISQYAQNQFYQSLWIFGFVFLLSSVLMYVALSKSIVRPIQDTTRLIEDLSLGRLDLRLTQVGHDEIGRMRSALNQYVEHLEKKVVHLKEISEGDLNQSIQPSSQFDILGQVMKEMSENLRHSQTQLLQEIDNHKESKRIIEETQSQLIQSEKMSSLGQLVSGVAHEINNPVNFLQSNHLAIEQSIDLIKELLWDLLPDDQEIEEIREAFKAQFSKIERYSKNHQVGTQRLTDIVSSLKSFTRHNQADAQEVLVHEIIEDTLVILQNKTKEATIHTDFQAQSPLYCHASQLGQVCLNLINNALYAAEHHLKETRSTDKVCLMISTREDTEYTYIRIQDNGPGVPPEIINHIFDPFFTTKPVGEGTGLGLSISFKIIKDHQGILKVENNHQGACFIIQLPFNMTST